jgi:hypothetical protein
MAICRHDALLGKWDGNQAKTEVSAGRMEENDRAIEQ